MRNFQKSLKKSFNAQLLVPKLCFVLRDHPDNDRFEFGFEGGRKLLEFYLAENEHRLIIDNARRTDLKSHFKSMDCMLLPNPGKIVARFPSYNGNFREIDSDFSTQMEPFFKSLFDPDKICTKFIGNGFLTGFNLIKIIQTIWKSESDHFNPSPPIATTTSINIVEHSNSTSAILSKALPAESMQKVPAIAAINPINSIKHSDSEFLSEASTAESMQKIPSMAATNSINTIEHSDSSSVFLSKALTAETMQKVATSSQHFMSATLELVRRQESYDAQNLKMKEEMRLMKSELDELKKENFLLRARNALDQSHSMNDKKEIENLKLQLNNIDSQLRTNGFMNGWKSVFSRTKKESTKEPSPTDQSKNVDYGYEPNTQQLNIDESATRFTKRDCR